MRKYLWTVLGVVAFAVLGCELDKNSADAITGDGVVQPDGQQPTYSYTWVVIRDGNNQTSTAGTCGVNPGADIDAVFLLKGGQQYPPSVVEGQERTCLDKCKPATEPDNVQDCKRLLSKITAQDEDNPDDTENKFISLAGGEIAVQFAPQGTPLKIEKGDTVKVFEVQGTLPETYYVFICDDAAGTHCADLGSGSGPVDFHVN